MNTLKKLLSVVGLWLAVSVAAHAGTVTYIYTDNQGTPLAEADAQGNVTATFDYRPYGAQALGTPPKGPGYTGHVSDPDTGLVYMQARYYDAITGKFLSPDPAGATAGSVFKVNRYVYANNNPVANIDPDGKDCTSSNRVTTCSTVHYIVSFTQQPGFQDFTSSSSNYHAYDVPVATPGMSLKQDQQYLTNNPTPGFPSPATPEGTSNDATPVIGGFSPLFISPVKSFSLTNQLDGKPVVVNVTEPGHALQSGVVVREATQSSSGTAIQTWGEGTAGLQAPGSIFAEDINNVWKFETPGSSPSATGCSSGWGNACSK